MRGPAGALDIIQSAQRVPAAPMSAFSDWSARHPRLAKVPVPMLLPPFFGSMSHWVVGWPAIARAAGIVMAGANGTMVHMAAQGATASVRGAMSLITRNVA